MIEFRAGQRIRLENEGTLKDALTSSSKGLAIHWDGADGEGPLLAYENGQRVAWAQQATITVLAEPRPEEPTGLGAVVEAGYEGVGDRRYMWVHIGYGQWVDKGTGGDLGVASRWDELLDPNVIHVGVSE